MLFTQIKQNTDKTRRCAWLWTFQSLFVHSFREIQNEYFIWRTNEKKTIQESNASLISYWNNNTRKITDTHPSMGCTKGDEAKEIRLPVEDKLTQEMRDVSQKWFHWLFANRHTKWWNDGTKHAIPQFEHRKKETFTMQILTKHIH